MGPRLLLYGKSRCGSVAEWAGGRRPPRAVEREIRKGQRPQRAREREGERAGWQMKVMAAAHDGGDGPPRATACGNPEKEKKQVKSSQNNRKWKSKS